MSEFVDKNFSVYFIDKSNKVNSYKIGDLLPHSFKTKYNENVKKV